MKKYILLILICCLGLGFLSGNQPDSSKIVKADDTQNSGEITIAQRIPIEKLPGNVELPNRNKEAVEIEDAEMFRNWVNTKKSTKGWGELTKIVHNEGKIYVLAYNGEPGKIEPGMEFDAMVNHYQTFLDGKIEGGVICLSNLDGINVKMKIFYFPEWHIEMAEKEIANGSNKYVAYAKIISPSWNPTDEVLQRVMKNIDFNGKNIYCWVGKQANGNLEIRFVLDSKFFYFYFDTPELDEDFVSKLSILEIPLMNKIGDLNNDGKVDKDDISLLEQFFSGGTLGYEAYCAADISGDGIVDKEDLELLKKIFGIEETTIETTKPETKKGDINNDGKTNGMDLLLMKQHILEAEGKTLEPGTQPFRAADMNDDGKINGMDLLLLKKHILS